MVPPVAKRTTLGRVSGAAACWPAGAAWGGAIALPCSGSDAATIKVRMMRNPVRMAAYYTASRGGRGLLLGGAASGAFEPTGQLVGGLVRRRSVKRHQRRRASGRVGDLRTPSIMSDGSDFDDALTAVDRFGVSDGVHVVRYRAGRTRGR